MEKVTDQLVENEGDFYDLNRNPDEIAAARGCVAVIPKPNELQIDIDSDEAYEHFLNRFGDLGNCYGYFIDKQVEVSKSGLPHRHITVIFPTTVKFSDWQRIALQFTLGSDPVRESLNSLRVMLSVENPCRLFKKKE